MTSTGFCEHEKLWTVCETCGKEVRAHYPKTGEPRMEKPIEVRKFRAKSVKQPPKEPDEDWSEE